LQLVAIKHLRRNREMACFLVPVGEAIVTTVVQKVMEKREKKTGAVKTGGGIGLTWSKRLGWLNKMLWGGSLLLALEHVWHGEIIASPPFLTAMQNPEDTATMLHEIATFGVTMAVVVTAVWGVMILVVEMKSKSKSIIKTNPVSEVE
jgi:hypothetical protein